MDLYFGATVSITPLAGSASIAKKNSPEPVDDLVVVAIPAQLARELRRPFGQVLDLRYVVDPACVPARPP